MLDATIDYITLILKVGIGLMLIFFGLIGYRNTQLFLAALFGQKSDLRPQRKAAPFWEQYK